MGWGGETKPKVGCCCCWWLWWWWSTRRSMGRMAGAAGGACMGSAAAALTSTGKRDKRAKQRIISSPFIKQRNKSYQHVVNAARPSCLNPSVTGKKTLKTSSKHRIQMTGRRGQEPTATSSLFKLPQTVETKENLLLLSIINKNHQERMCFSGSINRS